MRIENEKTYKVWKYDSMDEGDKNYGQLPGSDVKQMLKGYKYDSEMGLWFSRSCRYGYEVEEVED